MAEQVNNWHQIGAFDRACSDFSVACVNGACWRNYDGAAYRSRIEAAFTEITKAYGAVCAADDLDRTISPSPAGESK